MHAVEFKQAATEGNSSGGMIYQSTVPSFTQQRLPRVALPLHVSPM